MSEKKTAAKSSKRRTNRAPTGTKKIAGDSAAGHGAAPAVPQIKSTRLSTAQRKESQVAKGRARLLVRMYRHGLGDCLLLRFAKTSGNDTFNILIDCGLIGAATAPKGKMTSVVKDIVEVCNNRIDIAVMTHEHWDHASGYSIQQVQALFDAMEIREVWYAWTEDPTNSLGRKLREERAAKVRAVSIAAKALAGVEGNALAATRSNELANLLSYFGVDKANAKAGEGTIGKTRAAFEYLLKRPGVRVRYKHPTDDPYLLPGVSNVRVFAFGPPEDETLLKKSRPTKSGREVYELAAELSVTTNLEQAFDRLANGASKSATANSDCPFDESWHQRRATSRLEDLQAVTWNAPGEEWRRVEFEWTHTAENLAIDLDSHTNNSCLVLAFEFTDTGEVFLFPGDAQVGNWLSWERLAWDVPGERGLESVTAHELLARTVFYKVGHHGSHNATLRALGLELMTHEDLIAFVPVVEEEAYRNRWSRIPFIPLLNRLAEKTRGRLLRSDDRGAPQEEALDKLTPQERTRFQEALTEGANGLYYELSFG